VIKMIFLLVGLAVGFGGGVYWGVKYPTQARKMAAEEERRFIEAQKSLLEKTKRKLDELIARGTGGATSSPAGGAARSTLVSPQGARTAPAPAADPEVLALREEHERQLQEAEKLLKDAGRL
jgi:hypothetical protein